MKQQAPCQLATRARSWKIHDGASRALCLSPSPGSGIGRTGQSRGCRGSVVNSAQRSRRALSTEMKALWLWLLARAGLRCRRLRAEQTDHARDLPQPRRSHCSWVHAHQGQRDRTLVCGADCVCLNSSVQPGPGGEVLHARSTTSTDFPGARPRRRPVSCEIADTDFDLSYFRFEGDIYRWETLLRRRRSPDRTAQRDGLRRVLRRQSEPPVRRQIFDCKAAARDAFRSSAPIITTAAGSDSDRSVPAAATCRLAVTLRQLHHRRLATAAEVIACVADRRGVCVVASTGGCIWRGASSMLFAVVLGLYASISTAHRLQHACTMNTNTTTTKWLWHWQHLHT